MKKLFALLLFLTTPAFAATYYVSPAGNDANAGTQTSPWRTIQKGHDVAVAGDIVYVRGGTYILSKEIAITRDGVEGSPIQLLAYPGELPVLDGISMTNSGDSDIRLGKPIKMLGANWWIIDGFEVKRGPGGGVIISEASNNNIIRRLKVHHNGRLSSSYARKLLMRRNEKAAYS
jgi:hypothetical protein